MDDWEDFHSEFDGWTRTEGDCDRAGAASALQLYNQRFSEIASRVRGLSQVSYLSPVPTCSPRRWNGRRSPAQPLKHLGPYESDVYRGWTRSGHADKLRRLADRRVQELLERNGIPLNQ